MPTANGSPCGKKTRPKRVNFALSPWLPSPTLHQPQNPCLPPFRRQNDALLSITSLLFHALSLLPFSRALYICTVFP